MFKAGDTVKVNEDLADNLRQGWGGTPRVLKHFLSPLRIKRIVLRDAEFAYPKWYGGTFFLPLAQLRRVPKRKAKS